MRYVCNYKKYCWVFYSVLLYILDIIVFVTAILHFPDYAVLEEGKAIIEHS